MAPSSISLWVSSSIFNDFVRFFITGFIWNGKDQKVASEDPKIELLEDADEFEEFEIGTGII